MSKKLGYDSIDADYAPEIIAPKFERGQAKPFCGIATKYDPVYCEAIIEHCNNGFSAESFSGDEYISPDTIVEWMDKHPEFKSAVKIAKCCEALYYEQYLRFAMDNIGTHKDILPSLNRKIAMLERSLANNGISKSLFQYEEPDKGSFSDREDQAALDAFENM